MKIGFVINKVFSGWSPTDTRLGGTEESIVKWAEWLAKFGHEVSVYNVCRTELNGVQYYQGFKVDDDVLINVKAPEFGGDWYFTNETDATKHDLSKFKGVIWPSHYAKDTIKVNNPNVQIIPHGYDPTHIYPQTKIPKTVLYASSPDRGLDTLLDVWPDVVRDHPDAMLIITYGAKAQDVPNTMFMGDVDEETMNELYRTSDIWCHPANGGELFGITGIKAQAAGCVPVYFPTMALAETVKTGVVSSPASLKDDLVRILGDETRKEAIRQTLLTYDFPTWESTAKQIEALVVS